MLPRFFWLVVVGLAVQKMGGGELGAQDAGVSPQVAITEQADGLTITLDGEPFTRYLTKSVTKPVLWPVIGPTEEPLTRAYPVGPSAVEETEDHRHHRSIWIGYEGVNGVDFWHEAEPGVERNFPPGTQQHRRFTQLESQGATARVVAETDWLDNTGQKVCEDQRTWTFGGDGDHRWLDCRLVLTASEGELRFSDSKEGFFAVRVADSMSVERGEGTIVNSRGQLNAEAWAQQAEWVDYHGPVGGETVGLAVFAHPETLNFPPRWHVRTYGLFAGNPLAKLAFSDETSDIRRRPMRLILPQGKSVVLHYRIVLHRGDEGRLAEKYARYIGK